MTTTIEVKYRTPDRLITPCAKSRNWPAMLNCLMARARSRPWITSAYDANTSGALKAIARMNATVRLLVRNDAVMPTESIAAPTSQ